MALCWLLITNNITHVYKVGRFLFNGDSRKLPWARMGLNLLVGVHGNFLRRYRNTVNHYVLIVIIILIIIYFFQVETVCFWIKSKITIKIMKKFRATHYLVNEL